jgi:hypothetical protein
MTNILCWTCITLSMKVTMASRSQDAIRRSQPKNNLITNYFHNNSNNDGSNHSNHVVANDSHMNTNKRKSSMNGRVDNFIVPAQDMIQEKNVSQLYLRRQRGRGFDASNQTMEIRALQTNVPYFTTTNTGSLNYRATRGNPWKGLTATALDPEEPLIDFAMEFAYFSFDSFFLNGANNTYDWTFMEQVLDATWGVRKRTLVPRVFIQYPPFTANLPKFLRGFVEMRRDEHISVGYSPYYGDPDLLLAMKQFIWAFASKYDGDPRIAFIEAGLLGYWGEWHCLQYTAYIPDAVMTSITQTYNAAFSITPIQLRYPSKDAKDAKMGYHDDSFTHYTLDGIPNGNVIDPSFFWPKTVKANHTDFWRYSPMGGKFGYFRIPNSLSCCMFLRSSLSFVMLCFIRRSA